MNDSYRVNTIITLFNVFDTIGRKFPEYLPMTKSKVYVLTFLRFIFLFTFPLVVGLVDTYWLSSNVLSSFTIVNMILFAFTNGYLTSTSFSLAPDQVPSELKGKSGSSLSFFLIMGIFSGSMYATLIMQNIVG